MRVRQFRVELVGVVDAEACKRKFAPAVKPHCLPAFTVAPARAANASTILCSAPTRPTEWGNVVISRQSEPVALQGHAQHIRPVEAVSMPALELHGADQISGDCAKPEPVEVCRAISAPMSPLRRSPVCASAHRA